MVTISRRFAFTVALLAAVSATAFAAKLPDVKNTKHNLSATPYSVGTDSRTVKATSESQICVFCHTPHKANAAAQAPLWNRALSSTATYTLYTSDSLNAALAQPDGSSKLCLSCHDGTMALGSVGVLNGQQNVSIAMQSTNIDGSGASSGYTRNLGTTLANDHPISFTYNSALATTDGELVDPAATTYIKNRTPGASRPHVPLENDNLQCVACHDPHIRDSDTTRNAKFLRLNRFQQVTPSGGAFSASNDQVCLGCHSKAGWSGSAHANQVVATQTYTATAASQREFDTGLPVWQAGCLNCHDTHTVQGARRLLREGTDSASIPKAGGNPAQEQTCYQCHDGTTNVVTPSTTVPNIKSDFALARRMPITSTDQPAGSEVHSITDKDFTESTTLLGKTVASNRHVECTDCHNPHRVIKNRLFNANPVTADAAGTHTHTLAAGQTHTNLASGVLAGTTGVEPVYGATTWGSVPTSYTVKKGNGGVGADTAVINSYVTREYQVCLKCHSSNAWTTPPLLGGLGLTPSGTNGVTQYTDQAMEFQAPLADKGEKTGLTGVAANHRSWHPVMDNTGRTAVVRGNLVHTNFLAPWSDATATNIGNQTMYCSDCHGSNVTSLTDVVPNGGEDGNPWGPHGSTNNFILKGNWLTTGTIATIAGPPDTREICFKCHDKNAYSPAVLPAVYPKSGFACVGCLGGAGMAGLCNMTAAAVDNLHIGHKQLVGELRCTWCHTAVPHGWINKALLVDITGDTLAKTGNTCNGLEPCTVAPYYQKAYLGGAGVVNWKSSGNWIDTDCGGGGAGGGWMNNTCNAPQ